MRAKVIGVFIGQIENSFEDEDGRKVEYRQISVNIPGQLEAEVISVPKDVPLDNLDRYKPCFLIVDFRFRQQSRSYKARLVRCVADEVELQEVPLYYDEPETNGYLSSVSAGSAPKKSA